MTTFDPLGEPFAERYWEALAELRECPVGKTKLYGGLWIITTYDDVMTATRDWQTFSSAQGASPVPLADTGDVRLMPIETDPPIQRHLRRLIDRHFSPKAVALAEPEVRKRAVDLIDHFQRRGECEFVSEFSTRFPADSFFHFAFGVDPDETGRVMTWVDDILYAPDEAANSIMRFFEWTSGLLEARRQEMPRHDVLQSLLDGTIDGRQLTDRERKMVLMNLIIGGVETTTQVLGNVAHHLATKPGMRSRLDADRSLIPMAVEEFLRYEAPGSGAGRAATCPVEVGGAQIESGDRVVLYFGAANRDPAQYEDPDEIVLDRFAGEAAPHMTFGAGPHRCPGSHFARLEIRVVIEEMLDRLQGLSLATDRVTYRAGITRGPMCLPLEFRPLLDDSGSPR